MIGFPYSVRIFLHVPSVDLRKGFDALAAIVSEHFRQDPLSGHLFLFFNRRRDRVKILYWDRDGYVIWYKRLETGAFQLPRIDRQTIAVETNPTQLALILSGIDLDSARQRPRYQRPARNPQNSSVEVCLIT
jgi:transposase